MVVVDKLVLRDASSTNLPQQNKISCSIGLPKNVSKNMFENCQVFARNRRVNCCQTLAKALVFTRLKGGSLPEISWKLLPVDP